MLSVCSSIYMYINSFPNFPTRESDSPTWTLSKKATELTITVVKLLFSSCYLIIALFFSGIGSIGTFLEGPVIGFISQVYGWVGMFILMISLSVVGMVFSFLGAAVYAKTRLWYKDWLLWKYIPDKMYTSRIDHFQGLLCFFMWLWDKVLV